MRAVPGPGQQGQAEGEGDGYSKRPQFGTHCRTVLDSVRMPCAGLMQPLARGRSDRLLVGPILGVHSARLAPVT